ncbi:MAG: tRNA pseudouridine(54/55) synthase Pus10 [Methanobrevibacter sp.]|jgi:tRNA pseudouridine synthase 10|nr:tRNA pseudouridine(54/55) synthase Pus10 [Candidatus Methanovirga meridionalis]
MKEDLILKIKKLFELTNNNICNHCLGRKFSDILSQEWVFNELKNMDHFIDLTKVVDSEVNKLRGIAIRNKLGDEKYLNYNSCEICGDIFENIDKEAILKKIDEKVKFLSLEYNSFLIGNKIPKEVLEKDLMINTELDIESENIKKEINRVIGEEWESLTKREVKFENPDVVIVVDLRKIFKEMENNNSLKIESNSFLKNDNELIKVRIQINPLFIEGRYLKLIRGIPQTKWPCRKCRGRGCESCNFTGKLYDESIEELIYYNLKIATNSFKSKFHGAGREDIDVRMLGNGRPFVIEIIEPKIRNIDLNKLNKEINQHCKGKAKFLDLNFCSKSRIAELKVSSPDTFKIYCATIKSEDKISEEDLEKLQTLNIIKQETPNRVIHRRADLLRIKEVKNLNTYFINDNIFKMKIKTEGGLYIKELISGDENRTKPNVSKVLNTKCVCKELDVIEVVK